MPGNLARRMENFRLTDHHFRAHPRYCPHGKRGRGSLM